jgi:hypothetical protein
MMIQLPWLEVEGLVGNQHLARLYALDDLQG